MLCHKIGLFGFVVMLWLILPVACHVAPAWGGEKEAAREPRPRRGSRLKRRCPLQGRRKEDWPRSTRATKGSNAIPACCSSRISRPARRRRSAPAGATSPRRRTSASPTTSTTTRRARGRSASPRTATCSRTPRAWTRCTPGSTSSSTRRPATSTISSHLWPTARPRPGPKDGPARSRRATRSSPPASSRPAEWGKYPPPGIWNFYSYWHEMNPTQLGQRLQRQAGAHRAGPLVLRRGHAQGQLQPGKGRRRAGLLGGRQTHRPFQRLSLAVDRQAQDQQLLAALLQHRPGRPTEQGPRPQEPRDEVWFDDIVVATEYIGPIQGKPKAGKKIAAPWKSALLTPGLLLPARAKWSSAKDSRRGRAVSRGRSSHERNHALPRAAIAYWLHCRRFPRMQGLTTSPPTGSRKTTAPGKSPGPPWSTRSRRPVAGTPSSSSRVSTAVLL